MCTLRAASRIFLALTLFALLCSCEKRGAGATRGPVPSEAFVFHGKPSSAIAFLSTQMNPVEEAGKMRNVILKDFPGQVDFKPNDSSYIFSQIDAMLKTDPSQSILLGATHGDLITLYEQGTLRPMDAVYTGFGDRKFSQALIKLSRLNGKDIYYIPWTQASYVMVANKKALAYLPKGADLSALTYGQLALWAKNIYDKTGMKSLGFPAGKNGLMHRFFQGYLYPSFTASTLLKFRGPEAKAMWVYFKGLWAFVNSGSLVYSSMSEPLLTGDVWIAWDHMARLIKAFEEKPDDFVAFPAPAGPRGRGFMAIIAGMGIPNSKAEAANAAMLIDYLTQPAIQARMMSATGFLPVVELGAKTAIPPQLKELRSAVDKQTDERDAVPALAPVGLGEQGTDYNNLFMLTFSEIVLEDGDIMTVLNTNATELQAIIDKANAKCWLPDVSEKRPCQIE